VPADGPDGFAWYALRTRSRHEKRLRDQLATRGIAPFHENHLASHRQHCYVGSSEQ